MITLVMALAMAAPNPGAIDAPRHAFAACLKSFETNQLNAKVDPAAYEAAVKTACPSEADALSQALVKYDVAMGTKRANAESNAARDVDDYRLTSVERYRDIMANP
jgi:hypothetical protein